MKLRNETGMTLIFITHDIGLAYYVSDRSISWNMAKLLKAASPMRCILHPKQAYTKRLINDVPKIHEEWDLSTVELLKFGGHAMILAA